MAQIGLNISISGLTGNLIIRWVRASAPLAEVDRNANPSLLTFPYDAVYTIPNLSPVVYIVQLWRSDDGVALSQLIKDWSIDASKETRTSIITYQYKVGRGWDNTTPVVTDGTWADPADTDTNLVDTRLLDYAKAQMIVHEAGFGDKLDAEYDLLAGGGITLLGGKTFDQDVAWFITVALSEIITLPTVGGSSSMFEGVEVVTANQDFDDITTPLANKLVIANFAGSVGIITFPDLALIADGTHVTFNTENGSQKYLKLQFDAGDAVRYCNQNVNVIYVPKCQVISLYFSAGVCYVIETPTNALRRGQVANDYDNSRAADSGAYILADESTGELLEADYPGLYEFVAGLASGSVALGTSVGQWSYDSGGGVYPNKRYFGIQSSGTLKLRVPHLSGLVAKFGATPGLYEADNVGSFTGNLSITKGYSYTGAPNNTIFGNGANSPETKLMPFTYTPAVTETRVKSFGQIPFIIL